MGDTMKNMNKLYYLKTEIKELKDEINSLSEISASNTDGMPHGNTTSNPTEQYFLKKQRLIERLNNKLEIYIDELERIENVIDKIEDEDTRLIARMRYVDCCKWEEIARKVHLDRSVCSRKLKKMLEDL